ncbi:START domain-containing protein 10 isoform X2 [Dendroctonus ponderosae]|nr:START domain-containing protein 10 isoform X2 [Dendroctonus ponderosae]
MNTMDVGIVKIAEDSDFCNLKRLVDDHDGWKLEYDSNSENIKVWTKSTPATNFKMVKVHSSFSNITANTMFDVLHDPDYRKKWDEHMLVSTEIGYLNPNNDVGYYALSCPAPVKNRDFVLQRSWLDLGNEKLIINHSVNHKDYGQKKGFVRATSYLTGFVVRKSGPGCFLGYISQTDPKGKLPTWLVNKITQKFAPRVAKQLKRAAEGYEDWKAQQPDPKDKPWIYAEFTFPRISVADCINLEHIEDGNGDDEQH